MGEDDTILKLHQFGKVVKQSQRKQKGHSKNIYITHKKWFLKMNKYFLTVLSLIISQVHLLGSWIQKKMKAKKQCKGKKPIVKQHRKDHIYSVMASYHIQWMGCSILIRRRRQNASIKHHFDSSFSPKHPVAYFFHEIDCRQQRQCSRYRPRASVWDVPDRYCSWSHRLNQWISFLCFWR